MVLILAILPDYYCKLFSRFFAKSMKALACVRLFHDGGRLGEAFGKDGHVVDTAVSG